MKDFFAFIAVAVLGLGTFFAIVFLGNALGLFNIQFWGVKYADANRQVFEHSKSYVHGTIRDIENLCLEMQRVEDADSKATIRATLNHRIAAFDGELPAHVRTCVNQ